MNRPHIICHMVTSIDGKILTKRWGKLPGGQGGAGLFETTAATFNIGSWLVGTNTMKEFSDKSRPLSKIETKIPSGDFIADAKATRRAIGTDARGELRFSKPEVDGDHIVVLTTRAAPTAYLAHLRKAGVSYLICGSKRVDLSLAMKELHSKLGLKKLMLQGGGKFNGAMLQAKLVDEISQVIVPIVDGGGETITGFVDAPGKPKATAIGALSLIKHTAMKGGAHWFRWRVRAKA